MKHLISFCSHYVIYGLRILLFSPIKVRDHLLYSSNPKNKVTKGKDSYFKSGSNSWEGHQRLHVGQDKVKKIPWGKVQFKGYM